MVESRYSCVLYTTLAGSVVRVSTVEDLALSWRRGRVLSASVDPRRECLGDFVVFDLTCGAGSLAEGRLPPGIMPQAAAATREILEMRLTSQ